MLKVGIIGCGFMGSKHADCYKSIDGVELCAVADVREECAAAAAKDTNAVIYGDGKELIEKADLDIIDICLPTYLHSEYAIMAMEKVKYLFVEKPVSLTVEQGKAMISKAKETGCNVQVGQVIRFWDEYVKLKEIIDSGIYGKVVNANFRRISSIPTWGWNEWLLKEELSGGAAQDLHIHDSDFALFAFGMPKKVSSAKNIIGEANSYICSLFSYDDFVVTVEGTWGLPATHPFEATFRVVFEKATVENAGGKFLVYTDSGVEEIKLDKADVSVGSFEGGNISDLGGYYNELVYFTDCAKNGARVEKATVESAVGSVEFVLGEIANA